jgi:hypothetical protein
MIWTMRIECVTGRYRTDNWIRVVEMDSGSTLFDLHLLILREIHFDHDHLFEFFVGRNYRHRAMSLTDELDVDDFDADCGAMTLEQVFPLPKKMKLFYYFDFGDDWRFETRKTRKKPTPPVPGIEYPRVIEAIGPNPEQYGRY